MFLDNYIVDKLFFLLDVDEFQALFDVFFNLYGKRFLCPSIEKSKCIECACPVGLSLVIDRAE